MKTLRNVMGIGMLAAAAGAAAEQGLAEELAAAVKAGTAGVEFRYRYEWVDQDGIDKEANASTLRSRLWASSGDFHGFSVLGEADNVTQIGPDDYNSTENGKTEYPVVADPKGTVVGQACLKYSGDDGYGIYGRQRVNLSNQRFVGSVGWRQNEQSVDGLRGYWQALDNLSVDYTYAYRVNRIFGPDDGTFPADWWGDNNFLYVDWAPAEGQHIGLFGYYVDVDSRHSYPAPKTVDNSSQTAGVEYIGSISALRVRASFARQSDAGDSELDYDADYYLLEVGGDLGPVALLAGYEVLASGDGVGFATPLATLHKFQGWADKFLNTPTDGVEDLYGGVSGKLGPVKLDVVYHDFQAEDGGGSFGKELDLAATWPVNRIFSTQLKFAGFDGDRTGYTDTYKVWLTLEAKI